VALLLGLRGLHDLVLAPIFDFEILFVMFTDFLVASLRFTYWLFSVHVFGLENFTDVVCSVFVI